MLGQQPQREAAGSEVRDPAAREVQALELVRRAVERLRTDVEDVTEHVRCSRRGIDDRRTADRFRVRAGAELNQRAIRGDVLQLTAAVYTLNLRLLDGGLDVDLEVVDRELEATPGTFRAQHEADCRSVRGLGA